MNLNQNQKEAIKKGIEYLKTHDWCQVDMYKGPITKNPDNCQFCALGAIVMANGFNPKMDTMGRSLEYHMYEFAKMDLDLFSVYQRIYQINDSQSFNKDNVIEDLEELVKD